jgi:protein-S-isoprenylcysteine O-methyltransferase Ste14
VVISLLAVVFTVALAFATLQLPVILGNWLSNYFPDIHPVIEPERMAEFMVVARPIGYACLAVIAILIAAGFMTGKRKLSIFGSFAFFLPTFGYFFASMFFLAGLGILRIPFIPFWDPSINLMNLGDISYLPYMAVVYPSWLAGVDIRMAISWVAVGLGLFIFVLGTITWFYGRVQGRKTVDFWIYRYTRHPQYLGFMIWSYGVMLVADVAGHNLHRPGRGEQDEKGRPGEVFTVYSQCSIHVPHSKICCYFDNIPDKTSA